MKLEICANSYDSAITAEKFGADRIELCSEISNGGITPSYGMLTRVIDNISIPAFVLIRPRSGNFVYSNQEFEIMKQNINLCKKLGYQGIVSGVLNSNNSIDSKRTRVLVELAKPLKFTFHRAFDCVNSPDIALNQLCELGVDRILTSGQAPTAEAGLKQLKRLQKKSFGKIILLPGGGINSSNVEQFKKAGFAEIHTSASSKKLSKSSLFSAEITYSDPDKIKAILNEI
ncbi:MAG: copper homeostasis protein CutC [Flavobacteriaceae bacterium]|mgnify:FL=1|jgi:copper homeostasis protein|nr:copper homeostasis protein CutC [Bacteroidota bacterium]MDG1379092.1 copper homeostasis protein CutC [Flavobacteriaceae bacterium]MDG2350878.1 copper homeostasis protein CutC [Flavobacteriaceae bacterium]|tara:strand:+ start:967 stop:1656 length:690 start_codon:yes stop_codon:yes gene_type:complete